MINNEIYLKAYGTSQIKSEFRGPLIGLFSFGPKIDSFVRVNIIEIPKRTDFAYRLNEVIRENRSGMVYVGLSQEATLSMGNMIDRRVNGSHHFAAYYFSKGPEFTRTFFEELFEREILLKYNQAKLI